VFSHSQQNLISRAGRLGGLPRRRLLQESSKGFRASRLQVLKVALATRAVGIVMGVNSGGNLVRGLQLHAWRRTLYLALMVGVALSSMHNWALTIEPGKEKRPETPIHHVVIFFQENESFDHYFGTYPNAANLDGEMSWIGIPAPRFIARDDTPSINGIPPSLLVNNPNKNKTGAQANPQRLRPADAYTCTMNHGYSAEQQAVDSGLADRFPQSTAGTSQGCQPDGSTVMNYYDGNTVTALWNYAQHYAMSDNSFETIYGPTNPGHINLMSGNTHGGILRNATSNGAIYQNPADGSLTVIGNIPAYLDDCGGTVNTKNASLEMTGRNVGDLLNAANVTWGWFSGGFAPTQAAVVNPDGTTASPAICGSAHTNHQVTINGATYIVPNPTINFVSDIHTVGTDYYPAGIEPFMFYASTRNPHHLPPSSVAAIGRTDRANHQYDTADFFAALKAGDLPAVSFVKAPAYLWGHPGNSDPLVEQAWLVQGINAIMKSPFWSSTAIIIAWDDSDGWYDHVTAPVLHPSGASVDFLAGPGNCGTPLPGADQARCGPGPRLPLLVISPWAKSNYVDHALTDQVSILAFIEQNWRLGYIDGPTAPPPGTGSFDRTSGSILGMFDFDGQPDLRRLLLDPITGTVVQHN
jgi:phospholipase C